jgi:hypothetical protein
MEKEYIMKYWLVAVALMLSLLTACAMTSMMGPADYNAVAVGGSIQNVESIYGCAFDVKVLPGGVEEHYYIQRIELPSGTVEQTTYVFTVCQGKIVGKEKRENRNSCHRYIE